MAGAAGARRRARRRDGPRSRGGGGSPPSGCAAACAVGTRRRARRVRPARAPAADACAAAAASCSARATTAPSSRVGRRRLLFTVDALVEGVHFRRGWLTPRAARPQGVRGQRQRHRRHGRRAALVRASTSPRRRARRRPTCSRDRARRRRGRGRPPAPSLVGGNLSRAARARRWRSRCSATRRARPLTARAARGRAICSTSPARSARRRSACACCAATRARAAPRCGASARRRRGCSAGALLARAGVASAMIDVSDGLVQDLGHLCARQRRRRARSSSTRVPCSPAVRRAGSTLALGGGEDYELLCAVPAAPPRAASSACAARLGCPLHLHRRVRAGGAPASAGASTRDGPRRVRLSGTRGGHDHFAVPRAGRRRMSRHEPDRLRDILAARRAAASSSRRRRLRADQAPAVRGSRLRQGRPPPRPAQRPARGGASAPGKTAEQIVAIARRLRDGGQSVLITRLAGDGRARRAAPRCPS